MLVFLSPFGLHPAFLESILCDPATLALLKRKKKKKRSGEKPDYYYFGSFILFFHVLWVLVFFILLVNLFNCVTVFFNAF